MAKRTRRFIASDKPQNGPCSTDENGSLLTRRQIMILTGGAAATLFLPGCGGFRRLGGFDSGPDPGVNPPGVNLVAAPRSEPTGDLQNQINQFSETVDLLSSTWMGQSEAFSELDSFIASNPGLSRSRAEEISPKAAFQGVWYGINATREAYERTANFALALDDVGYVGDKVTNANGLKGTAAVNNPQWIAAMIEQNYHSLGITGSLMQLYQKVGLGRFIDFVKSQTDPTERGVAYGIVANVFNDWVDAVAASAQVPANESWKLDLSESVTVDNLHQQVDRIAGIVNVLPFGPGYRTASGRSTLGKNLEGIRDNYLPTLLGSFVEFAFKTNTNKDFAVNWIKTQSLDMSLFRLRQAVTRQGLWKNLGGDLGNGLLTNVGFSLVKSLAAKNGPKAGLHACLLSVAPTLYDIYKLTAASVATAATIVGPLVFGSLAAFQAQQAINGVENCFDDFTEVNEENLRRLKKEFDERAKSRLNGGNEPPGRDVPARTNPSRAECDQLAAAGIGRGEIELPPDESDLLNAESNILRELLCGALTGSTRSSHSAPPRTFKNVELAAAGLLLDFAKRNANTIEAQVEPNKLRFFRSDFALLIRREPGSQSVTVPAITNAQLLCSSPGFIPMRSDSPKDLTQIPGLPELQPITELGTGVNVGVR